MRRVLVTGHLPAIAIYGDLYQDYDGVDVTMNVRLAGVLLQDGLSSGRELYDVWDVRRRTA